MQGIIPTVPPARLDILVASLSFLSHDILCFSKLHEPLGHELGLISLASQRIAFAQSRQ